MLFRSLQELNNTAAGLAGTGFDTDEYTRLMEEVLNANVIPEAEGFGKGVAPSGLFQVVIDFEEMEDERDEAFMELTERWGSKVRTVNL